MLINITPSKKIFLTYCNPDTPEQTINENHIHNTFDSQTIFKN